LAGVFFVFIHNLGVTQIQRGNFKVILGSANTEISNMSALSLGLGYITAALQIAGHDMKLLILLDLYLLSSIRIPGRTQGGISIAL
jgi:hypothetical protein